MMISLRSVVSIVMEVSVVRTGSWHVPHVNIVYSLIVPGVMVLDGGVCCCAIVRWADETPACVDPVNFDKGVSAVTWSDAARNHT
jgi:hypothetical protein